MLKALRYRAGATLLAAACMLAAVPTPVAAADPVELVIGGSGAVPWSISGIVPGQSGTQVITVQNGGTTAGNLTIWVSDIVNTEGTPATIQPDADAVGDLGDSLTFEVVSGRLTSTVNMPALIDALPQSAADSDYLRVLSLAAGETVTFNWNWSLPAATGNDAQGDSLSFSINYLLEQIETQPAPGPRPRPRPVWTYEPDYSPAVPVPAPTTTPGVVSSLDLPPEPTAEPDETPSPTTTPAPITPPIPAETGLPWYYLVLAAAGAAGLFFFLLAKRRRRKNEDEQTGGL